MGNIQFFDGGGEWKSNICLLSFAQFYFSFSEKQLQNHSSESRQIKK